MKELIGKLQRGEHLTRAEAKGAFDRIMAGAVDGPTLGAFLCALAYKGEVVDELVGAAQAMRSAATRVRCDRPCMCTCGTGGDGISTFNVSTTAAIIASAAGAVVAKHGNRTNTRTAHLNSRNVLAVSDDPDHTIAVIGGSDLIVVRTADVTLVVPASMAERVKDVALTVEPRLR